MDTNEDIFSRRNIHFSLTLISVSGLCLTSLMLFPVVFSAMDHARYIQIYIQMLYIDAYSAKISCAMLLNTAKVSSEKGFVENE